MNFFPIPFSPCISMVSSTLKGLKIYSITPPAKLVSVFCKSRRLARPAAPAIPNKEVVVMPIKFNTKTTSNIFYPVPASVVKKLFTVPSTCRYIYNELVKVVNLLIN